MINKIRDGLAETVVETLCDNILASDEILKETSGIGLKTVIAEISADSVNLVGIICTTITHKLIDALEQV